MDVEGDEEGEEDYEEDESAMMIDKDEQQYMDMQHLTTMATEAGQMVHYDLLVATDNENSEIIDENYDPSDFLLQGRYGFQQPKEENPEDNVSNDLVVSDSEDESNQPAEQMEHENDLWF